MRGHEPSCVHRDRGQGQPNLATGVELRVDLDTTTVSTDDPLSQREPHTRPPAAVAPADEERLEYPEASAHVRSRGAGW